MIAALGFQIAKSFLGDSTALSVLNQLNLALFTVTLLLASSRTQRRRLFAVVVCHFALIASVAVHFLQGKQPQVLLLGHLDNLKFLLPLALAVLVPQSEWAPGRVAFLLLRAFWYVVVAGVFLGIAQQFVPSLLYSFLQGDEEKIMYRYGILRVPSYFAEINAFARVSFLLLPLSLLLRKGQGIAVVLAFTGFALAFSRQFILGALISLITAAYVTHSMRLRRSVRIALGAGIAAVALLFSSIVDVDIFDRSSDDRLLSVSERYIRTSVAITSIEVLKDRPIFGVGPGHFGGNIGKKFGVTEDLYGYGLLTHVPYFDLEGIYYTDTLWPQLAAEYGLAGLAAIISLFLLWQASVARMQNPKFRLVAIFCIHQLALTAATSPVFNYLYFSISILILTMMMRALDHRKAQQLSVQTTAKMHLEASKK